MTALWNKRTDKYGGDLDGRLRFPIEIIDAVKRGAGQDFPVIISMKDEAKYRKESSGNGYYLR